MIRKDVWLDSFILIFISIGWFSCAISNQINTQSHGAVLTGDDVVLLVVHVVHQHLDRALARHPKEREEKEIEVIYTTEKAENSWE